MNKFSGAEKFVLEGVTRSLNSLSIRGGVDNWGATRWLDGHKTTTAISNTDNVSETVISLLKMSMSHRLVPSSTLIPPELILFAHHSGANAFHSR